MKKSFITLTLIAVFATFVFAENPSTANVAITKSGTVFKVFYKADAKEAVKVSIVNAAGEIVYVEHVKTNNGFIRPYNFSNLPFGDYTIIVEGDEGRSVTKVVHAKREETLLSQLIRIPDSKKCLVTLAGASYATVTVKDQFNKVLYERQVRISEKGASTLFDFSKLTGAVSVQVSSGDQEKIFQIQ